MIIRCGKCKTKFRFEESIISGDGVWVRCSRCGNVFFQETPFKYKQDVSEPEMDRRGYTQDAVEPVMPQTEEIREDIEEESNVDDKEFDTFEDMTGKKSGFKAGSQAGARVYMKKKSNVGKFFAYFFLVLFIVLLLAGIYLWAVPEDRRDLMNFFATNIPIIQKISRDHRLHNQVTIKDVNQHFVNNWLMGNLRVLEGTAVNNVDYSLTRIQVKGRIYDAGGAMIGERVSFCGNLLTDSELTTMTEEEIQKRLSQPLGGNTPVPNDRVKPRGRIPFMIVFSHEPPAVAKATVMVAGVEKLLE